MVIQINTDEELSTERIPLFSIDGKEYGMLKEIPGHKLIEIMDLMKAQGEAAGGAACMQAALGFDAYQALRTCQFIKPTKLKAIMKIINEHVLGQMESEAQGN